LSKKAIPSSQPKFLRRLASRKRSAGHAGRARGGASFLLRCLRHPWSEPDGMTRLVARARSTLYTVAVRNSSTNIPLAADKGSGGRDHSAWRHLRPRFGPARPPGSTRTDQVLEEAHNSVQRTHQAAVMIAPSTTTPALTYFHSATSSLRASATIVVFLRRPLFCLTRSLNQKVSADRG
jgi:hypothetical protein